MYRPFFEDLYSQLTESPDTEAEAEDSSRRYGLPRRRSTTPPSAFTEVVEIYEVHPKTRLRITTRAPTTRTQEAASAQTTSQEVEGEDADYNYQDDYVYQPTTSASAREEQDTTASSPPLEYQEYVPTVKTVKTATEVAAATEEATTAEADEVTEAADVHETGDKHPTTTTLASVAETTFSYEAEEVDRVELDIQNEIGDQVVEESQQVETTWNEVIRPEEDHTLASSRLTEYQKDVDTSHYGVDTEYNVSGLQPQVSEHSKPGVGHGEAGAGWPSKAGEAPVRSYTEIDRSRATAHVEEVPITAPRDYSEPDILYDLTKDGFDDDTVDTFSVPVSVAFNVPEAETTTTTAAVQEQTTAEAEAETSTVSEVQETTTAQAREAVTSTTARQEEGEATTTEQEEAATTASPAPATTERLTTAYSRLYSLINRNRNSILAGGHLVHAARDTTTARGEVYLGTRPAPAPATTAAPTTLA